MQGVPYRKVTCESSVEFWHANRKTSRYSPSNLEIIEQGQRWVLVVNSKSKSQPYKLSGNITKIYNSFANEGKSSIELKLPAVVIYVRGADPEELRNFLIFLDEIYKNPSYVPKELNEPDSGDDMEEAEGTEEGDGDSS
eukprot:TRINITY_DN6731_c0_g1_i1.p1 TRINITY_DN6731_c0_g1~~TRINITY_DN6731_c0_g1_i1.p1  ORF type:complete len:139 (+),score=17.00 TRINITY_DN6731_c0_g1_i1:26-442(+)